MKRELNVDSEIESSILIVKAGRNVENTPIKTVKDSLILFWKETLFWSKSEKLLVLPILILCFKNMWFLSQARIVSFTDAYLMQMNWMQMNFFLQEKKDNCQFF